jgi:hypothetical protein
MLRPNRFALNLRMVSTNDPSPGFYIGLAGEVPTAIAAVVLVVNVVLFVYMALDDERIQGTNGMLLLFPRRRGMRTSAQPRLDLSLTTVALNKQWRGLEQTPLGARGSLQTGKWWAV